MFPLSCSRLRVSISKMSRTPLSTIATRCSSSAVTLTSIDFDIQSPRAREHETASTASDLRGRAGDPGGLDPRPTSAPRERRRKRGSIASPLRVRKMRGPAMGSERTRPIGPPGRRLLVLGAGPVGLEAALYALSLGYDARVVEAGRVGEQVLEWGHVRMFSPWAMNCSPPGLGILAARGLAPYGDGSVCPTGRELVERYLVPLTRQAPLRGRIARGTRVVAVGRDGLLKGDLAGSPERGGRPFRILVVRDGREAILHADLVIDATGTYVRHRFLGDGGIPAPGEIEAAERIDYRLVDLEGPRGSDFAGRRVLLVGAGHSAATSAAGLASLVEKDPRTRVLWAY